MDDELIQEQIEYYRRKALDYDASAAQGDDPLVSYARDSRSPGCLPSHRTGAGDRVWDGQRNTPASGARLFRHRDRFVARGHGAGTQQDRRHPRVRFVEADVFAWEPEARYDVVYFGWWLCHVPLGLFDRFWELVRRALKPRGRVFFEDESENAFNDALVHHPSAALVRRTTSDGGIYRVVKVFWDPAELEERLGRLGWDIRVHPVGPFFWGEGSSASDAAVTSRP